MDISTIANLTNAIAVTAGVIFAAAQIRQYRHRHRREQAVQPGVDAARDAEQAQRVTERVAASAVSNGHRNPGADLLSIRLLTILQEES